MEKYVRFSQKWRHPLRGSYQEQNFRAARKTVFFLTGANVKLTTSLPLPESLHVLWCQFYRPIIHQE